MALSKEEKQDLFNKTHGTVTTAKLKSKEKMLNISKRDKVAQISQEDRIWVLNDIIADVDTQIANGISGDELGRQSAYKEQAQTELSNYQ